MLYKAILIIKINHLLLVNANRIKSSYNRALIYYKRVGATFNVCG